MSHEATLIYTEPLLRHAVFAFWRRSVGVTFMLALAVVAIGLGLLVSQGERGWLVGALGTTLGVGVWFAVALYLVHYRNSIQKLREMGDPRATFRADESSFTINSGIGNATLPWSTVKEVWRFPEVWLLLYSKAHFSTLPVACLSSEMQAFVLQRVQAAGGRVDAPPSRGRT